LLVQKAQSRATRNLLILLDRISPSEASQKVQVCDQW
jgi:hypothetical protein